MGSTRLEGGIKSPNTGKSRCGTPVGFTFLEVIIDVDAGVNTMVGPGLSYDQMITGDFIPTRSATKEEDIDSSEMF